MSHPPPEQHSLVIVGAGLAGLACALHIGRPVVILEREAEVGGVARTFVRDGFCFDTTGHWLHFADAEIEGLVRRLLDGDLVGIERRAAVYAQGIRTAYPFQANTFGRPAAVVAECVLGYFRAREAAARGAHHPPETFEDFIRQRLGDGIARHFMIPYNTKLWTVPPAAMDHAWCARFVPTPTPEEVLLGALRPAGAGHGLGYNATFSYPRTGGIGRLAEALHRAGRAEVRTGVAVTRLDWRRRLLEARGGMRLGYQTLVSTMPLPDLVAALVDPPEAVRSAARALTAASVTYWDVGFALPNAPGDPHWTYFPDPDVPFYRVGSPSAVLASLAPAGCRSLCVEVSHRRGERAPATDEDVLRALRQVGLAAPTEEPLVFARTTLDCAYVIMDREYGAARARLLEWLEGERILSVGRYGAWMYDSMEGAIQQGQRAAARVAERC